VKDDASDGQSEAAESPGQAGRKDDQVRSAAGRGGDPAGERLRRDRRRVAMHGVQRSGEARSGAERVQAQSLPDARVQEQLAPEAKTEEGLVTHLRLSILYSINEQP
jgi:hypothetical protein